MLEGLEISILNNHDLERTLRFDSEFYSKKNILLEKRLKALNANKLTDYAIISDGNHMSISDFFTERGVPYYRGGDIYNMFIEQCLDPLYIPRSVFNMKAMQRSHLKKGDILMSIVGAIIGNLSLVSTDNDATCSCKLAIIRPFANLSPEYMMAFLMSEIGQSQIQRYRRGSGQTGFILEDFDQLLIPELIDKIDAFVRDSFNRAKQSYILSVEKYNSAITLLYEQMNLQNLQINTSNIKIQNYKDSFLNSGRLDAEYYQSKYDVLFERLSKVDCKMIKEIKIVNYRGFQPKYVDNGTIDVINSKHILEDCLDYDNFEKTDEISYNEVERSHVKYGDILTYTTGANIGRTQVYLSDKKAMTSNHVNMLRVKDVNPIYLALVLNSMIGRMQTERACTGSAQVELYPEDIENFIVPILSTSIQEEIANLVQESFEYKKQSKWLLQETKQMVEAEIEKDNTNVL